RWAPRCGAGDAVVRITKGTHHTRCVRIFRTGEARAFQAVEAARVEVAEQPRADVTHMRPLACDARGVWRERCRDPDRRAHLPTMRGVERRARTGVGCARARRAGIAAGVARAARVHPPATGDATSELLAYVRLDTYSSLAPRRTRVARSGIRGAHGAVGFLDVVRRAHPHPLRIDLAARHRAGVRVHHPRTGVAALRGALAGGGVAAPVALVGRTRRGRMRLHTDAVLAPRLRAEIAIGVVAARLRAVGLLDVARRTHPHPLPV